MGLKISATLPLAIVEFIVVVTKVVTMKEVYICLKRPATLHLVIWGQFLILMVEVDIGTMPATLPLITQVMMREYVYVGLKITATVPI